MDFDGYGLGGAFLKESLGEILKWCNEELPEHKPRHLLGLSRPDDILIGAQNGADTFDCVALPGKQDMEEFILAMVTLVSKIH